MNQTNNPDALLVCDLHWPEGKFFTFHDDGGHNPCYIVMPDGGCLPLNHWDDETTDIARAKWIINACNEKLDRTPSDPVEARAPARHLPDCEHSRSPIRLCECPPSAPVGEVEPDAWLYEREGKKGKKSEVALFRWRVIVDGKWWFGAEGWIEVALYRAPPATAINAELLAELTMQYQNVLIWQDGYGDQLQPNAALALQGIIDGLRAAIAHAKEADHA